MTPLANSLTKEMLNPKGIEGVKNNQQQIADAMKDAKFFEVTGIKAACTELITTLGGLGNTFEEAALTASESTAHLCFMPYPKMWFESASELKSDLLESGVDVTGSGKTRSATILEDMGDFMVDVKRVYWTRRTYADTQETAESVQFFHLGQIDLRLAVRNSIAIIWQGTPEFEEVDVLMACLHEVREERGWLMKKANDIQEEAYKDQTRYDEMVLAHNKVVDEHEEKRKEEAIFYNDLLKTMRYDVVEYLILLNTPKALETVEHEPHRGILKDLRHAYKDRAPYTDSGWTQVTLHLFESNKVGERGNGGQGPEAGSVALHFCRKHLRIKRGKLEIVRGHWRGDPNKGMARRIYKVVP